MEIQAPCFIAVNSTVLHYLAMSRADPQVNFRIPADLKAKLEAAASEKRRSITAEVVARLQATIDLDALMAELKAGSFAEAPAMLESVLADNDRMTASGEQTYSTAYSMLDQLLDEKLKPLREQLHDLGFERQSDTRPPTGKKPIRKRTRPLGIDQAEWDAQKAAGRADDGSREKD